MTAPPAPNATPSLDADAALRLAARFSMAGRNALVTGGSISIGRSIALAFADAGADVAIHHDIAADAAFGQPDAARETARSIVQRGRRAAVIAADFAVPGEAAKRERSATVLAEAPKNRPRRARPEELRAKDYLYMSCPLLVFHSRSM